MTSTSNASPSKNSTSPVVHTSMRSLPTLPISSQISHSSSVLITSTSSTINMTTSSNGYTTRELPMNKISLSFL